MTKNRWTLRSKQIGVIVDVRHDSNYCYCTVLWATRNSYLLETHVTGALIDAYDLGSKDGPRSEECTSV